MYRALTAFRACAITAWVTFACAAPAFAQQSYVWTGATSNDWNTASNWNPNGVPGGNPEDVAHFNIAACSSVTVSQSVELGAISFAYGPACSIQINAFLQLRHGILNLSTTTRNTFTIGTGTGRGLSINSDGDAANSDFVNNGFLVLAGTSSAGTAQITNNAGATFALFNSASAANAVIYNGGTVDNSYLTSASSIGAIAGGKTSAMYLGHQILAIGNLNYFQTIDGTIADGGDGGGTGGGLTKVGTGGLQLTGNDTYTGKTTVQQGMLEVDGSLASPEVLVMTGAQLAGTGTLAGTLVAQAGSRIIPGTWDSPFSPPPNQALTAGRLFCAASPTIYTRIGNVGSDTRGNYLVLNAPLQHAFCSHLHFSLASAGLPLTVGSYYLLVAIQGSTDYGPGNVDFDFDHFTGYTQATGNIVVTNFAGVSAIYLQLTGLGDEIFHNGFE